MERNGIAREKIDDALASKSYDYVASTYYLLAEQKLQERRGPLTKIQKAVSGKSPGPIGLSRSVATGILSFLRGDVPLMSARFIQVKFARDVRFSRM